MHLPHVLTAAGEAVLRQNLLPSRAWKDEVRAYRTNRLPQLCALCIDALKDQVWEDEQ